MMEVRLEVGACIAIPPRDTSPASFGTRTAMQCRYAQTIIQRAKLLGLPDVFFCVISSLSSGRDNQLPKIAPSKAY